MAEWKQADWRKSHRRGVTSEHMLGIGPNARSLFWTCFTCAWWDEESPEGRMLDSSDPTDAKSIEQLGVMSDLTPGQARSALEKLRGKGTLDVDDHGVVILPKFRKWQRGESYERVKKHRGNVSTSVSETPCETDNAESRLQIADAELKPQTPQAGPPVSSVEPKPDKPRRGKPRLTPPDGLAEHVFAELVAACRSLSPGTAAGPRKLTAGMRDSLAKLHAAEEPSAEEWSRVIRRRLQLERAGDKYGALDWEHLCRPANFRRYRDYVERGEDGNPVAADEMSDWALEGT